MLVQHPVAQGVQRLPAQGLQSQAAQYVSRYSPHMQVTVVMKFGGSSVANAERMREVAAIVCSFPDELPCVVLSAMGKVCLTSFTSKPQVMWEH